jgi:hypothetical protein
MTTIEKSGSRQYNFLFSFRSTEDIEITAIDKDCDCVSVPELPLRLGKGKDAIVSLIVQKKGLPASKELKVTKRKILIYTNPPLPRPFEVEFECP